jgi:ABC-type branched-subunit amino acid transport system ATPase component/branched-subunit amino acid ABC-type transport system permease component
MTELLTLMVSGGVAGAIVSLIASGIVLSYSTSGVFNFAYAAIAFSGAYLFWLLNTGLHWPTFVAAFVSVCIYSPLLGLLLDVAVLRGLSRAPEAPRIIGTVGLLIAIPAIWLFFVETILIDKFHVGLPKISGAGFTPGLGPVPKKTWVIADTAAIDSNQVIVLVAAAISAVVLWVIVRHTRLGLTMRATVDRERLASMRGVNTGRVSAIASMMSAMLAGLAGVVGAPIVGLSVDNYTVILFTAAGAVVLARFRSIPIAFAAGILIGILQNMVAAYGDIGFLEDIAGIRSAVPALVLLIGLLVMRPTKTRSAGAVIDDAHAGSDGHDDLPLWRRRLPWCVMGAGLFIYTTFIADAYWKGIMAQAFAMGLIFLSITIITGLGGIISLAQGTFVTAAGLIAAFLVSHGVPVYLAMLLGVLFAVVLGAVVALPSVNLDGLSLTLATLALAFLGSQLLFQIPALRNDGSGYFVGRPHIGPLDLDDPRTLALTFLVVLGIGLWLVNNLRSSPWGRSMLAVRASSAAARSVGVHPTRTKLLIFATCAGFAGVGGLMLAITRQRVVPDAYPAAQSMVWVATAVLFGVRRPSGAVLAGLAAAVSDPLFHKFTDSPYLSLVFFGLGAIGLASHPEGAVEQVSGQLRGLRMKRANRRTIPVEAEVTTRDPVTSVEALVDGAATLEVRGMRAGYGEAEVLHGIDLALAPATITVLLGANGAGKSTLAQTLAGLLPFNEGTVVLDSDNVTASRPFERVRGGLCVVPESRGVFPGLTVEENLEMWLPESADRDRVYDEFHLLANRRTATAWNLSGGEQQILAMAPMLIRPPKVLIADEPTLGLAPLAVQQLMDVMQQLRDIGVSILLVEEKAVDALALADRVAILELGRIVWVGPPAELDASRMADAYFGASERDKIAVIAEPAPVLTQGLST